MRKVNYKQILKLKTLKYENLMFSKHTSNECSQKKLITEKPLKGVDRNGIAERFTTQPEILKKFIEKKIFPRKLDVSGKYDDPVTPIKISVGDYLPHSPLFCARRQIPVSLHDALIRYKYALIFGILGVDVPICSLVHTPGYHMFRVLFENHGVGSIICIAVNDRFVCRHAVNSKSSKFHHINLLADPGLDFTNELGLATYIPSLRQMRSRRYSLLIKEGRVEEINVEKYHMHHTVSSARFMLAKFDKELPFFYKDVYV